MGSNPKKIQFEKTKDSRIRSVKQREKLSKYLHTIADLPTGTALAHGTSANKRGGGLSSVELVRTYDEGEKPDLTTEPSCSTISTRSSSTSTSSATPSANMMRYRDPPERTHHPTPGINRVCRRDPPVKSRRDPASSAARVASEDDDDGNAGGGGGGASSLTAVLLAFLNVSPLLLVARRERGSAEGKNRGRGLTVM